MRYLLPILLLFIIGCGNETTQTEVKTKAKTQTSAPTANFIEYEGFRFEKKAYENGDNFRLHRCLEKPNLSYKFFFYPEYNKRKLGHGLVLNGKPDGKWEWWHPDTGSPKRQEEYYKNGQKNGIMTKWYYNGNKQSAEPYVNDVKEGKATMWKENGEVDGYVWWKNNERDRYEKVTY